MGWFSSLISGDIGGALDQAVGNVSSGIGNLVSGVESAGRSLDDIVNDIPGGWGTVAAATGIYYAPELGEYIGASGGGLTESQVKQAVSKLADSAAAADVALKMIANAMALSVRLPFFQIFGTNGAQMRMMIPATAATVDRARMTNVAPSAMYVIM